MPQRRATQHEARAVSTCDLEGEVRPPTDDEAERSAYVEDVLGVVADAITGGVDVRGLFWWTGVDNYEWHKGYDVRFGLFDRDRNPKPAASIARAAALG